MAEPIRHEWNVPPRQAVELQRALAGKVEHTPVAGEVRTVAGVDCAFFDGGRQIVAAAVLLDAGTLERIAAAYAVAAVRFPYVPGLLTFREAPAELEAIAQLPRRPDLLMVDGAGVAHPRRIGIAAHVGLWLALPTIGVAKSRLCGQHEPVDVERGSTRPLTDRGEVVGQVVRTRAGVRPLYVSVGQCITLDEAVAWTLRCAPRYRLPEPTRAADRLAAELKARL